MKLLIVYRSISKIPSHVVLYARDLARRYYDGKKIELIFHNTTYNKNILNEFKYVNFQYIDKTPAVILMD